jgi:hypothetical protein
LEIFIPGSASWPEQCCSQPPEVKQIQLKEIILHCYTGMPRDRNSFKGEARSLKKKINSKVNCTI